MNTYGNVVFVIWALLTAWLLVESGGEWKKTTETVQQNDKDAFLLQAPKRIAPTFWTLHYVISIFAVMAFWLFHYGSIITLGVVNFGVAFLVALAIYVLKDIDDPITGVINVADIPDEWRKELEKKS